MEEIFATYQPQIVFHAAACKHVPLMEKNPFSAARTNTIGTHRVADAAARHATEQFILLSTDKAVDAASIMGATKRIAELIVLANACSLQMKAVRLGNVLGSSGSVVPLFLKQIAAGGPVTVTHPDATRYFITLDEAVWLLLSAVLDQAEASVLIPEPGEPRRISELAEFLIARVPSKSISIEFTKLRPGDRLHERLMSDRESFLGAMGKPLRAIDSPALPAKTLHRVLEKITESVQERDIEGLVQAIRCAVPEYQAGAWLLSQAELPAREMR
jgi:FlaA1/EpsC-like NDP-sugar epimerase